MEDVAEPEPARSPQAEAARTIAGVRGDLADVAADLPASPNRAEHVARILDQLAEEIAEAAAMLRQVKP